MHVPSFDLFYCSSEGLTNWFGRSLDGANRIVVLLHESSEAKEPEQPKQTPLEPTIVVLNDSSGFVRNVVADVGNFRRDIVLGVHRQWRGGAQAKSQRQRDQGAGQFSVERVAHGAFLFPEMRVAPHSATTNRVPRQAMKPTPASFRL